MTPRHTADKEKCHDCRRPAPAPSSARSCSTAAASAPPGTTARIAFSPRTSRSCAQAGYLLMAVPEELGGSGLSLAEVCQEQRRLAYRAPATALATNMHLYWTGVAADLTAWATRSLEWMLRGGGGRRGLRRRARRGRQRPAGAALDRHGRARRRRLPLQRAQDLRQPDARSGRASACTPWTRRDPEQPEGRARLHAARHARLRDQGDLGHARHARHPQRRHHPRRRLRARPVHRARSCPPGWRRDPFIAGALRLGASRPSRNIYYGIAQRARDLAVASRKKHVAGRRRARWPTTPRCSTPSRR